MSMRDRSRSIINLPPYEYAGRGVSVLKAHRTPAETDSGNNTATKTASRRIFMGEVIIVASPNHERTHSCPRTVCHRFARVTGGRTTDVFQRDGRSACHERRSRRHG